MSYTKQELSAVIQLCIEVRDLAGEVTAEANECRSWDVEQRAYVTRAQWPYWGGTKASGALRRKTLDLTRALAQLRKS